MPETTPFITPERVRWADVDLVGIMRYSAFPRLIELAEQELFRAAGMPYSTLMHAPDTWLPRRQLTIEYFLPARIDDALSVVSYVTRMGHTSLTFAFDVRRSHDWALIAAASIVVVCVTSDTFAKCALPLDLREALGPYSFAPDVGRGWRPVSS